MSPRSRHRATPYTVSLENDSVLPARPILIAASERRATPAHTHFVRDSYCTALQHGAHKREAHDRARS